jgi:GT2 family glycosyltransferase
VDRPITVDVCVVTHNSSGHLAAMLTGLQSQLGTLSLYIRDNASTDGTVQQLEGMADATIEMGANSGFAAGVNSIAARGDGEFILLLNPDCVMPPGVVDRLVQHLLDQPSCAAVAPLVLPPTPHGRVRTLQGGWEPSLLGCLLHSLGVGGFFPRGGLYLHARQVEPGANRVDWIGGACVLLRRSSFEAIGGFSERWFMYSEDIDLGRRLRESGWGLEVLEDVHVLHEQGGSISTDRQKSIGTLWVTNLIDYYGQRQSSNNVKVFAFRQTLALGFALRAAYNLVRRRHDTAQKYAHWHAAALHSTARVD